MGSLLAALTTLIVTVLAFALAAPYVLDWNQYKSVFESQAAKMIGRQVRIEGDVGLTILPVPEVRLSAVKIADEAGSFREPFAEAEQFKMTLALSPLLSGIVEARELELDQPVMRFQVDAQGRGNWTTLGPRSGGGAMMPAREVVLHNVNIKDGAIEYRGAPDAAATRIDQVSGTFSADSLQGPFRFTGFGAVGRDRRELKLSAGRVQKDGALRLKASLSSASGGSLYQLDGDLRNLSSAVQYTGPVLARLELGGAAAGGKGDRGAAAPQQQARSRAIELRAASTLTLQDARLKDIALTVTENDRPQSFTGSAYAAWGDEPRLDLSVQASFLDLDQMIGTGGEKTDPLRAVAVLPQIFQGWAFDPRQGRIEAKVQQANLGGDIIEGVTFTAAHNREYWQVEALEARLPGDASLSIKGVLKPGDDIGFTGELNLSGKHLPRLLHWTAPGLGAVDTGDAQNFSLKGGLTYADNRLVFRRAAGQLGDSTFSGDLAYDSSTNSKLVLTLQSDRLDLRSVYGGNPFATGNNAQPQDEQPAPDAPAAKTSLLDAFRTVFAARESQISLRIAQLRMPDLEARDVRTVFRYENGTFDIREFNVATTDGLSVKADGQLTNFDTSPNGSINLAINAPSTPSVANLAKLFGFESFGTAARRRMDALAPLRVTGQLSGNRQERQMQLTLAGNAAGSELTLSGRFDGDFHALRDAKLDLGGTIANADGRRLIAQIAPESAPTQDPGKAGAGVLTISAQGALNGGLDSRLELRTPEAEGRFEGQLSPLAEPAWGLKGDLWLRAGQASTALSILRMSPGGAPVSGLLEVRAGLSKAASKIQVANINLQLGGQMILGSANIDISGERPVADVEARATSIALPKLAAYLVDWDRKDLSAIAENLIPGNTNIWPNHAFSLRSFGAIEGSLKLKAPVIVLTDGISLANGQFEASMRGGTVSVETLKGQLYGGAFTAGGTLAATDGRAVLNGRLKLEKADLAKLTLAGDSKPLARSTAEFRLSFNGEGLSPRGLLTVLNGKGRVKINRGTLFGLSPAVLASAGDAYLMEEIPQQNRVTARIAKELRQPQGQMPFRGFIAPVAVKDGVLEISRAGFKSPDALAAANLLVDLQMLKLDSEWSVSWRGKTKAASSLPPVQMVFTGPVANFTALQPQLQTEAYERALSMQRMDRDMERLEKLNRAPPPASEQPFRGNSSVNAQPPLLPNPPTNALSAPTAATPDSAVQTQQTAAPVQPAPPPAPTTGWSAGVESAGTPQPGRGQYNADSASQQGGANATAKPPRVFEDEIRRILQEQQKGAQPAQPPVGTQPRSHLPGEPRSNLSYQAETNSQTAAETAEGIGLGDGADPAHEDTPLATDSAVPLPERKSAPPRRRAQPATQFQQFLDLFN